MKLIYRVESGHVVSEKALSPVARFKFFYPGSQYSVQHAFAACRIALFVIFQWRDNSIHDRRCTSGLGLRKCGPQFVRVLLASSTSDGTEAYTTNKLSLSLSLLSLSLARALSLSLSFIQMHSEILQVRAQVG